MIKIGTCVMKYPNSLISEPEIDIDISGFGPTLLIFFLT
jgi:hypothetical protein